MRFWSICPKHWQLPTGDGKYAEETNQAGTHDWLPIAVPKSLYKLLSEQYAWKMNYGWPSNGTSGSSQWETDGQVYNVAFAPFYIVRTGEFWLTVLAKSGASAIMWTSSARKFIGHAQGDEGAMAYGPNREALYPSYYYNKTNVGPLRCLTQ